MPVALSRGDAGPPALAKESRWRVELEELDGPGARGRPVAGARGLSRPAGVRISPS